MRENLNKKIAYQYCATVTPYNVSSRMPVFFSGDVKLSVSTAKHLGYDAIELHVKNPIQIDHLELQNIAAENNIQFSALATGLEYTSNKLSLIGEDVQDRLMALKRLKQHIDLAQKLKCCVIIGCVRGNIPETGEYKKYEGYLLAALKELSDYAQERGVIIVLEAINAYVNNYLNTVKGTADFIASLHCPNIKLHIDTHHMNIEDRDFEEAIEYARAYLGYVHVSDSNRMFPGAGNIDFKKVLYTLKRTGYAGYISFECIPLPDPVTAARKGLAYLKALENVI